MEKNLSFNDQVELVAYLSFHKIPFTIVDNMLTIKGVSDMKPDNIRLARYIFGDYAHVWDTVSHIERLIVLLSLVFSLLAFLSRFF